MHLPVMPPIEPMLAKLSDGFPAGSGWLYEPKWDGFRAIVFRDQNEVFIQSRDLKPMNRYFPELVEPFLEQLPQKCVIDGEVIIIGREGIDFEALLLRIHPAASRVAKLATETPASFVAWDLLSLNGEDLRALPQAARRTKLEGVLQNAKPPIHITPATFDRELAEDWFKRFEGAGLDGVIAKGLDTTYQPGKRAMIKIKHARTADCAVAGFRWHKNAPGRLIGSLLLGLYDRQGVLHHVGITSAFTNARRAELVNELAPLREHAMDNHPWRNWADFSSSEYQRKPGAGSRWNRGKDLSWEPLRIERVCEVAYDHLQGDRFRHGTTFLRWRPDREPSSCTYQQLEVAAPYEFSKIFAAEVARP